MIDAGARVARVARVAWRFGATTDTPFDQLFKRPPRGRAHRYLVTYEGYGSHDVTYAVLTGGGQAKAVYIATGALLTEHPAFQALTVEVEDQGSDFVGNPETDLLAFDEVS